MRQTFGCVTCLARCTSRLNRTIERSSVSNVRQDGFERDPLAQLEILGLVELAHPAFRQEADDAETEGDDLASPEDGLTGRPGLTRLGACGIVGVGRLCRGRRTCLDLPTEQPLDGEMGIDARDHLFPWTGFEMKSTAPASKPRTRSFGSLSADTKITAASRVSGSALRRRQVS